MIFDSSISDPPDWGIYIMMVTILYFIVPKLCEFVMCMICNIIEVGISCVGSIRMTINPFIATTMDIVEIMLNTIGMIRREMISFISITRLIVMSIPGAIDRLDSTIRITGYPRGQNFMLHSSAPKVFTGEDDKLVWVGICLDKESYKYIASLFSAKGYTVQKEYHVTINVNNREECKKVMDYMMDNGKQTIYLRKMITSPDGSITAIHVEFADPILQKFCKNKKSAHITGNAPPKMAYKAGPMIVMHHKKAKKVRYVIFIKIIITIIILLTRHVTL